MRKLIMAKYYDTIIIGGGIVGLSLAALLIKHHFSVALVESKNTEQHNTALTARVSAIHKNSAKLFEYLNVWNDIPHTLMQGMNIWDHTQKSALSFELNQSAWIVENRAIIASLEKNTTHVDFYRPNHPKKYSRENNKILLTLDNDTVIETDLLVGADGAESWVRQQMQTTLHKKSYEQKAIIAVIESEVPHDNIAYQKFLDTGPVALLPLNNPHHTALVWSADNPISDALLQKSSEDFSAALTDTLDFKLGKLKAISERQQFPLIMRHANNYVDHHMSLMGDAAHTIHPLAGLGVNLGLMDAACLTEVLIATRAKKKPLGDYRALRQYARWRKAENTCIIDAMRGLKELFAINTPVINAVRTLAINTINQQNGLKDFLIKTADGSTNELPSFLK